MQESVTSEAPRVFSEQSLRPWLGRRDFSLEELIGVAADLIREIAPEQSHGKVAVAPDTRTLRYYTSLGLLPKPLGYRGRNAVYGSEHLLRLVTIKLRQSQQHRLGQIKRELAHVDEAQLFRLLTGTASGECVRRRSVRRAASLGGPSAPGPHSEGTSEPWRAAVRPQLRQEIALDQGRLVVEESALTSAQARSKLAQELRALAEWLETDGLTKGGFE